VTGMFPGKYTYTVTNGEMNGKLSQSLTIESEFSIVKLHLFSYYCKMLQRGCMVVVNGLIASYTLYPH